MSVRVDRARRRRDDRARPPRCDERPRRRDRRRLHAALDDVGRRPCRGGGRRGPGVLGRPRPLAATPLGGGRQGDPRRPVQPGDRQTPGRSDADDRRGPRRRARRRVRDRDGVRRRHRRRTGPPRLAVRQHRLRARLRWSRRARQPRRAASGAGADLHEPAAERREAAEMGLVNGSSPTTSWPRSGRALAAQIAAGPTAAFAESKAIVQQSSSDHTRHRRVDGRRGRRPGRSPASPTTSRASPPSWRSAPPPSSAADPPQIPRPPENPVCVAIVTGRFAGIATQTWCDRSAAVGSPARL